MRTTAVSISAMVTTGRLFAQDTLGTKDVSHIQTPVTRIVPPVNVIVSSGSPVRLSTRSRTRRTVVRWSINGASKVRQHGNKRAGPREFPDTR